MANVKNNVKPGRLQMTIWRMRIAWRIPKFSNTRSEYVRGNSYCFYSATMVKWKRPNVALLYFASVIILSVIVNRLNTVDHLHFTEHMT
jgi:hypothetical protein